jgi:hypothetical protein
MRTERNLLDNSSKAGKCGTIAAVGPIGNHPDFQ